MSKMPMTTATPAANGIESDRVSAGPAPFVTRYDRVAKLVVVTCFGFWTEEDIERYFHDLGDKIAQARRDRPNVRALIDLREAMVQDPGVMANLRQKVSRHYIQGDKVALVLQSVLLKLQMKRSVAIYEIDYFDDLSAAKQWLTTD